jgi:hypothetical protein
MSICIYEVMIALQQEDWIVQIDIIYIEYMLFLRH